MAQRNKIKISPITNLDPDEFTCDFYQDLVPIISQAIQNNIKETGILPNSICETL